MQHKGFTVIELLIVIVVISILAAITLVSYNSLQNGSYDSAVQSDLDSVAGLFESFRSHDSTSDQYPQTTSPDLTSLSVKATKSSYDQTAAVNFVYCINTTTYQSYALVALSKSGNVYMMTQDGFATTTIVKSDFTSAANICTTKLSMGVVSAGMSSPSTWQTWVNS